MHSLWKAEQQLISGPSGGGQKTKTFRFDDTNSSPEALAKGVISVIESARSDAQKGANDANVDALHATVQAGDDRTPFSFQCSIYHGFQFSTLRRIHDAADHMRTEADLAISGTGGLRNLTGVSDGFAEGRERSKTTPAGGG